MPKTRPPYSPEFRRQMVDLVRAGRSPEDLAREFEPTAQSIGAWAIAADKQGGRREEVVAGLASLNETSWRVCGERTSSSGWSAISSQKLRPGLHGDRRDAVGLFRFMSAN